MAGTSLSHILSRSSLLASKSLTLLLAVIFFAPAAFSAQRTCESAFKEDRTLPTLAKNPMLLTPQELPSRFAKRVASLNVEARMWEYNNIREELHNYRVSLSQAERSLIFYVLIDHPRMLFGELGTKLLELRGLQHHLDAKGKPYVSHGAIFDVKEEIADLKPNEEHQIKAGWPSINNPSYIYARTALTQTFLKIMSAIANYDDTPNSAIIRGKISDIKIQLALTKAELLDVVRVAKPLDLNRKGAPVDKSIPKDYDFRGYSEFRDFFKWLNENRDRQRYAELVLFHSFIPWLEVMKNQTVSAKDALSEQQTRVLRADAEPRLARRGLTLMNARKRYLESIRNSKLDMGAALYAFPTSVNSNAITQENVEPLYSLQGTKLQIEFTPALEAANVDIFALDHSEALHSAQKMNLVLTRASLALSKVATEVQQTAKNGENFFASLRMTSMTQTTIESHLQKLENFQQLADLFSQERDQTRLFVKTVLFKAHSALHSLETLTSEAQFANLDPAFKTAFVSEMASLKSTIEKFKLLANQTDATLRLSESTLMSKTGESQRLLLSEIK